MKHYRCWIGPISAALNSLTAVLAHEGNTLFGACDFKRKMNCNGKKLIVKTKGMDSSYAPFMTNIGEIS
jgi:hypothetical protein